MCFYLSPILHNFISAEKKHTYTVSGVYFLFRVRIIYGDVFLVIPNIAQFSFVRIKTERQTQEQTTFETRVSSENGKNIKKKDIQSVGTQLKVE